MLATKLNLSEDDAERWIVNLIRNARLDAKIDAKKVRTYMHVHVNVIIHIVNSWSCDNVTRNVSGSCDHDVSLTQGHVIMMYH